MDRRVEKTRTAIREAYFSLLLGNYSGKISIAEIARRANIDRKTFYLHYESTEDILKEFAEDKLDELIQRLKPKYVENQPIDVRFLFEALNQMVEENMEFFRFIALNTKYNYIFERLKELFVSILIEDYQKYFDFPDVEFRIYTDYFVSGILSAYMRWIREQLPISLDTLAELVSTAAYGGLHNLLPHTLQQH